MEGNNLNNMNVENESNENNIQPSVVNNQPQVQPVAPMETQTPMAPVEQQAPVAPVQPTTPDVVAPTQPVQPTTTPVVPTVEQNVAPVPAASTPNVDNNMSNNGNKKKKTGLFIALGLLVVAVIGVVIFFLLTNKDKDAEKEENKDTEKRPEQQESKPETELSWNGVYENEQGTIYLYETSEDELAFTIEMDGWPTQGTADIDGNTAEGDIFDTYTFKLNGSTIEFTTTDEDLTGGTFTKVKDYTKDDYYADNVGDASYLETGLNGVFEGNGVSITIYQTKADKANLIITKDYSTYQSSVDVVNGAILYQDEFFDDIESISASITGDTLVLTASSTDVESLLNEVSGTYTRTKTLTVDDILNLGM